NYDYLSKIKLLRYILKGEDYKDLYGIPLVPLFDGSFGIFGSGYFSITNRQQIKLFPKGSIGHFISTEKLREAGLLDKFQTVKFQNSTNIKAFDSFTISKVLDADLPRNSCIDY